jgi:hypothetical protein
MLKVAIFGIFILFSYSFQQPFPKGCVEGFTYIHEGQKHSGCLKCLGSEFS